MALAQPVARLGGHGPSWDEEVVPALRKRLESESRTLSKRMSAISLVSDDDPIPIYTHHHPATHSNNMRSQAKSSRANGQGYGSSAQGYPSAVAQTSSSSSNYQRSRTYSQPGIMVNGSTAKGSSNSDPRQQPTRIPKPSQRAAYGNGNTPQTPSYSPETLYQQKDSNLANSTTQSSMVIPPTDRSHSGLLQEQAPFPASPSASTLGSSYHPNGYTESPPRRSIDSEERPFEHWYRGEVSRNGGVGELRVGRQQEMLEIANYGHMMRGLQGKKKPSRQYDDPSSSSPHHHQHLQARRRAGSIGGLTDMERQRESVLFDDYVDLSLVMDEHPPTDIEGESDVASLSSRRYHQFRNQSADADYGSGGGGDVSMATVTSTMTSPAMSNSDYHHASKDSYSQYSTDERSTTPQPRSSESNSRNGHPPTRIPTHKPRRSTDSRSTTPTMYHPPTLPPLVSATNTNRSASGQSTSSNSNSKKGVPQPAPGGKKRQPVKSLRGGQKAPHMVKKPDTAKEVSQYPVPSDAEDDMSHAIPTWTQPVPKTGNWDEVVLPVVARQKGMDEFYQKADGKPQAPKVDDTPAPAPGTFGYDASKYRVRGPNDPIEMDDFGPPQGNQLRRSTDDYRPPPPPNANANTSTDEFKPYEELYTNAHDETRLPVRPSPSPMPFAEYAPQGPTVVSTRPSTASQQRQQQVQQQQQMQQQGRPTQKEEVMLEEEPSAGCCKCTIM